MTPAELRKLAQAAQAADAYAYDKHELLEWRQLRDAGYADPATALRVADLWDALEVMVERARNLSEVVSGGEGVITGGWALADAALDAMKGGVR